MEPARCRCANWAESRTARTAVHRPLRHLARHARSAFGGASRSHIPRLVTLCLALAFAITTNSGLAWADEFPPCDKAPSADDVEAAKGMHKAAEQYYAKARYERAISSWQDAYSFDCSAHRLLINIGNAYEKLGKTEKAIEAFEVYIARMGETADRNIVDKVNNLKEQLKSQNVVDPNPVPDPTPDPIPTPVPDPIDSTDEGPGPGPWILVGAGVAGAIVGGVLLGVGVGKENDALDQCPQRRCVDPALKELGNDGLTLQVAGGTVLAVGLVAVAGGVVWYLVGASTSSNSAGLAQRAKKLPVRIDVAAGPELTGLTLTGSF